MFITKAWFSLHMLFPNSILCSSVCVSLLTFVSLLLKYKKREVSQPLLRRTISPYSKDIMVTHPKVIIPVVCSASIIASFAIWKTTIAESTVRFFAFYTTSIIINTTIFGDVNLSIMQTCFLFDLLFDDSKCVHLFSPEVSG